MKFLNYELTDWTHTGRCKTNAGNYWRYAKSSEFAISIGLRFFGYIDDNNPDITKTYWTVEFNMRTKNPFDRLPVAHNLLNLYRAKYGKIEYKFHEIEQAKQDIDNFLIKIHNTKAFI